MHAAVNRHLLQCMLQCMLCVPTCAPYPEEGCRERRNRDDRDRDALQRFMCNTRTTFVRIHEMKDHFNRSQYPLESANLFRMACTARFSRIRRHCAYRSYAVYRALLHQAAAVAASSDTPYVEVCKKHHLKRHARRCNRAIRKGVAGWGVPEMSDTLIDILKENVDAPLATTARRIEQACRPHIFRCVLAIRYPELAAWYDMVLELYGTTLQLINRDIAFREDAVNSGTRTLYNHMRT